MADNIERLILDDSQFLTEMKKVLRATEETEESFKDLNETISTKNKKASKEFTDSNKKVNNSLKETAEKQRKARKEVEDNIKSTSLFGVSINDITTKLKVYKNGLLSLGGSLKSANELTITQKKGVIGLSNAVGIGRGAFIGLAKAINVAKIALLASGIGIAIVAVASLAAALSTSQKGMNKIGQAAAYASASFDVLIDKASSLGEKLLDQDSIFGTITSTLFGSAGLIFGYTSLGKEMDEAGKSAANVARQLQELELLQSNADVKTAKNRALVEKLKKDSDDITKSTKDRIAFATKAAQLENEQLETQIFLKAEALRLSLEDTRIRKKEDQTSKLIEENKLRVEIANLRADTETKQTELQNKRNALIKEQNDKLEASKNKLIAITKEVVNIAGELKIIDDKEVFDLAKKEQIDNLKAMRSELEALARLTGGDVKNQVETLNKAIDGFANLEFVPIIKPLIDTDDTVTQIESLSNKDFPEFKMKVVPYVAPEGEFLEDINNFEDLFNEALDSIFDSDKVQDKVKNFISGVSGLFSEFNSIINESTQLEVDAIDEQLDKLASRREILQDSLDKELADREKNLANNVGDKQEEVDAIIAEELRLSIEKEKIQKDAQKRQLLIDTLTQTQSIITTSINILKGFSQIPIFGLPLGIAAVGAMLSFFAKTKADAFKATKLHTGANRISDHFGFGERHGDTDLPGRGDGYRLVNSKTGKPTNTIISGREMLLPENVSISNEQFFHSMKNGLYNGIDLNDAMSFYKSYRDNPTQSKGSVSTTQINSITKVNNRKNGQLIPFTDKKGNQKAVYVVIDPTLADGSIIEIRE